MADAAVQPELGLRLDLEKQNRADYLAALESLQPQIMGDKEWQANYQKFVDVMSLCTQVNIARRK